MNPFEGNDFRTRADAQRAIADIFAPLLPIFRAEGARVKLGETTTTYDQRTVELEAFARPLFGIAPLVAGGGEFAHWDLIRAGLARGTDPDDPQYWGPIPAPADQRIVEMAPIGLALALVPEHIFTPLTKAQQDNLVRWLEPISTIAPAPNNWWFFRVLVNLGFQRVGGPFDAAAVKESLDTLESFYLGDGWYRDGLIDNTDFYNPWGFHFYGLIYAQLAAKDDPDRAQRFRDRAREFAPDWEAWFDPSGRVVPFGRSLTYRFGAAAFWGALAFAGEEALPWGRIRGLWARHMRYWATQPIAKENGVLSIGYSYPNLLMSETYNGPGSPYWAFKAALPLALGEDHPFWSTPEEGYAAASGPRAQPQPVVVAQTDGIQTQLLNGGRGLWFMRHGSAKYGKFAYSTAFGFSLEPDDLTATGITDSMLVLTDDQGVRRVRSAVIDSGITEGVVWSRWRPFDDVEVITALYGEGTWHVRIHSVTTARALHAVEAGFSIAPDDEGPTPQDVRAHGAQVATGAASSLIADLSASRAGAVHALQPNTNILRSRGVVPMLTGKLDPGTHQLACVVAATEAPAIASLDELPEVPPVVWEVFRGVPREFPAPTPGGLSPSLVAELSAAVHKRTS